MDMHEHLHPGGRRAVDVVIEMRNAALEVERARGFRPNVARLHPRDRAALVSALGYAVNAWDLPGASLLPLWLAQSIQFEGIELVGDPDVHLGFIKFELDPNKLALR